jgi:predicted nucleotidyltransferase
MNGLAKIVTILTQLKPELTEKYNVSSIGVFGSAVRQDFSPTSDVDIIVNFNRQVGLEFIDLANYIEKKLNLPVDLISRKGVKQRYLKEIEHDIIYV